jgi:hypothetical protein
VVTEVEPVRNYTMAEPHHQQYLAGGGRFGQPQSPAKVPLVCYSHCIHLPLHSCYAALQEPVGRSCRILSAVAGVACRVAMIRFAAMAEQLRHLGAGFFTCSPYDSPRVCAT